MTRPDPARAGAAGLIALSCLVMIAFAANSVLNRLALADGAAGPASFAALRLVSGALALAVMLRWRGVALPLRGPGRGLQTLALAAYVLGFSFAYVTLEAGVGALILFAGVQVTMFAGALWAGERPAALRWLGMCAALVGLVWLLAPGAPARPDPVGAALMGAAALGWGLYSLAGRGSRDPLGATGANFVLAAPLAVIVWLLVGDGMSAWGAMLAIASGVVTSALGYALWYAVLPRLQASVAALAQLSVPVIAVAGGVVFLGEELSLRLVLASLIVLGGIALGLSAGRAR